MLTSLNAWLVNFMFSPKFNSPRLDPSTIFSVSSVIFYLTISNFFKQSDLWILVNALSLFVEYCTLRTFSFSFCVSTCKVSLNIDCCWMLLQLNLFVFRCLGLVCGFVCRWRSSIGGFAVFRIWWKCQFLSRGSYWIMHWEVPRTCSAKSTYNS